MFWILLMATWFGGDLVWAWWADRQLRRLPNSGWWRLASAGFAAVMFGTIVWWIVARRIGLEMSLPGVIWALVMVWHLVVLPVALVGLILWGGAWGSWRVMRAARGAQPVETGVEFSARDIEGSGCGSQISDPQTRTSAAPVATLTPATSGLSRRQFLGATAAAIPPLVAIGSTGVGMYQLSGFRVRKLTVPVPNLPPALEGMTIAHVSDTHVGQLTRGKVLRRIADVTSTLDDGKPCDLVLMTGDLINSDLDDVPVAIDMLKSMKSRGGLFVVEGNHDLFEGWRQFDQMLLDADVGLLLNEGRTVEVRGHPVQLLGLIWGPPQRNERGRYRGDDVHLRESFNVTVRQREPGAFPILLAHHPHALDFAAAANIPLTLAGHTHGGQLMLAENIGPGPLMYRYWSGLYHKSNGCAGVISNGVGNWFPLRINAPAELLHLTLTNSGRSA